MAGLLDALSQTWPARMGRGILDAVQLPGQVAGGILATKPENPGMWSDVDEARQQLTQSTMMDRATDLAGLVMGGSYAAPAMKNASGMGIKAYHGSPHDFDRFDLSKIGTGEGAQAYGHGLYFAEREGTAKQYRDRLTPSGRVTEDSPLLAAWQKYANERGHLVLDGIYHLPDPNEFVKLVQRGNTFDAPKELVDAAKSHTRQGRMYEVNINAHPDQFLDWDKPIKSQPQNVRTALSPFIQKDVDMIERSRLSGLEKNGRISDLLEGNLRGGEYYNWQAYRPETSEAMRDAGIPGIKYLDQGSRGAGEGSRNYVVFDDKLIEILRKYGIAAPVAGGAVYSGNEAQAAP